MAKRKESKSVVIPAPEIRVLKVTVTGDSSLISHGFSEKSKGQIEDKQQQKGQAARGRRNPKKEFEDSLYKMGSGKYGFPASAFKKAMVDSCSFIQGLTKVLARGSFFVMGDLLVIKKGTPKMREDFVRLPGSKAEIRYRGDFAKWECELLIRYNAKVISPEQLLNLLANAGFSIGVGDWRPQCSGTHGMFSVKGAA